MQPCATAGGSSRVTATLQNASYAFDATRRSTLHQQGENDASDNDGVSRSSRCSPLEGRRLPEIHPRMKGEPWTSSCYDKQPLIAHLKEE